MTNESEIRAIVERWYVYGQITLDEKEVLKAEYLQQLGNPSGCTTCSGFWHEVQVYFRTYFKQLNQPIMSQQKYIVKDNNVLQIPGGALFHNGPDNDNASQLTNEKAEYIKETFPDYFEQGLIIDNPNYGVEPALAIDEAATGVSTDAGSGEQSGPDASQSADLVDLQAKYDTLHASHDELMSDNMETLNENAALKESLESAKKELSSTKGQLTRAQHKIAELSGSPVSTPATTPANPAQKGSAPVESTPSEGGKDVAKARPDEPNATSGKVETPS